MSALYYADEVRELSGIEELEQMPEVNPEELALAGQLIESISKPFSPADFEDNYRNQLLDIIKAKAEGREIVEPAEAEIGQVINLMDALKSSLQQSQVAEAPAAEDTAKASNQ